MIKLGNGIIAVRWSKCWYERHPWSDGGTILPYVGSTKQVQGAYTLHIITLGPVAILYGHL